ncbi:MAG: SulP family inorganic anion transporter [Caldilineaceae bacterium]
MYALFSTCQQIFMVPEATAAIMTASIVAPLAGSDPAWYEAFAAMTAILVGVLALLARVAKLGFITDFLSKPILVGYITGTALIVFSGQLGKMFGIKLESDKFFQQVAACGAAGGCTYRCLSAVLYSAAGTAAEFGPLCGYCVVRWWRWPQTNSAVPGMLSKMSPGPAKASVCFEVPGTLDVLGHFAFLVRIVRLWQIW